MTIVLIVSVAHLNKHDAISITHDKVYFTAFGREVSLNRLEAARGKIPFRNGFIMLAFRASI
jgi:hypothetical protein